MDFKGLSDPVIIHNTAEKKPSIFQKLKPPTTDFFESKKLLGGVITVLLLFAVGLGVYITQRPTQFAPKASEDKAEISLKPSTQTVGSGQNFQSDIFLDTKGLTVSAAQVKITFNPASLQLISVSPGNTWSTYLSQPENTSGSTSFTLISNPGKKTAANLATLTFKAIASASATPVKIEFDQSYTQAAAIESGNSNVASGYPGSEITISATGASPSPSASPGNRVTPGSKGDGNSDGFVDYQDLSILFTKWSPATDITGSLQLDFNNDKRINSLDYSELSQLLVSMGVVKK
jgi:hypothetical protein